VLSARVIEKKDIAKDVVSVGSTVKLRDMGANKTVEYRIVGSAEANPAEQKLSNESPVGKAILGKKKGEVVEVAAPRGSLKFNILEIKAAMPGTQAAKENPRGVRYEGVWPTRCRPHG